MTTNSHHDLESIFYNFIDHRDHVLFDFLKKKLLAGVWVKDLSNPGHEWASDNFKRLVGYDRVSDGETAEWRRAITDSDDLDKLDQSIERHLRNPEHSVDEQVRYRNKDGSVVFTRCCGMVSRDNRADAQVLICFHIDLTQQKQAEQALAEALETKEKEVVESVYELKEAERLHTALFNKAAIGIARVGLDGSWLEVNHKLCQIVGYSKEELLARTFQDITHPDDLNLDLEHVNQLLAGRGDEYTMEKRYIRKDGSFVWIKLTVALVRDDKHQPIYFISAIEDIEPEKQIERELLQARAQAEAATLAKSAFLASMSHEIRTPMTGVQGMAEILATTDLSDNQREMVTTILTSSANLLSIINDILDFSKIESGKLDIEDVEVNLFDVVESAVETLAVTAKKQGVRLATYIAPQFSRSIRGDPTRLRQIILNLASNAVKFSEAGDKVIVRAEEIKKGEHRIRLSVKDEGIGIPEEARSKLFQEFSQSDSSTTRRYGGTGLGLAISLRLARLMGGTLNFESQPGEGSTFWCEIPFKFDSNTNQPEYSPNIEGLTIGLLSTDPDYIEACSSYLFEAGGNVILRDELEGYLSSPEIKRNDCRQIDAVVILEEGKDLNESKFFERFKERRLKQLPKVIKGVTDLRGSVTQESENRILMSINPLLKRNLIQAVAIATGRQGQDISKKNNIRRDISLPTAEVTEKEQRLILVAEDNRINQSVIRRQLGLLGFSCEIANDGEEAFKMLQQRSYALLLTDCHMPNCDGMELTARIRSMEQKSDNHLPIVAITANALQGEAEKCLAAGMDGYLPKPISIDKLKNILKYWLDEKSSRSADTEQSKPDQNKTPVDVSVLRNLLGNDESLVVKLLNSFLDSTPTPINQLIQSIQEREHKEAKQLLHDLKTTCRSVGAIELADLMLTLDHSLDHEVWEIVDQLATKIVPLFKDATTYIRTKILK